MAVCLESTVGLEAALASSLFYKLKELQCPPVEGLFLTEPESMQELLCTPSIHRLDILEWICARISPLLQGQFSTLKESQTDVKIKEMARLGFQLMICQAEDLDLIKGLATPQRQLSFMNELVDVIRCPDCATGEAPSCSFEETCMSRVQSTEELLKEMFSSPHFQSVRNPECNPWPSDIKPLLLGGEPLQKRNTLAAKTKDAHLEEYQKMLRETSETLDELKEECSFLGSDALPDSSTVVQALKLAVSDFLLLTSTFSQIYEDEFKAHCSRPAPQISDCGPLFQSVHVSLGICSKELQAIAQFSETSDRIVSAVHSRQVEKEAWGGSSMMTLSSKIEQLRKKYEHFHTALHG
ncbi:HAUS augmin-like complex subunit 7 [Ambystoma mexicanum]|uniref:HAUS augmin-like complex subunit 7 n=1 Tax=Ambystoma mexicanum TaxID=8296 RepID=UPI0037E8DC10